MRYSNWLGAGIVVSVLTLAGCDRPPPPHAEKPQQSPRRETVRAITRLDCPDRQGGLKRLSVATDGLSCVYDGAEAEVLLRLIALNGGNAEAVLAPIETELKALMPSARPPTPSSSDRQHETNKASIHLPGIDIDASDGGADIKIGSLTINADDGAAEVKINKNVGQQSRDVTLSDGDDVNIRANDHGAEVRHNRRGGSIRSTLILASDKAPNGYRVVGYEARGPKGGPIAVATLKAKNRDSGDHDVFKDMKALVRHNVGG